MQLLVFGGSVLCALVSHAYLGHGATEGLIRRWKPQITAQNLVSTRAMKQYATARLMLECRDDCGCILSEHMHLFLVTGDNSSLTIHACLWHDDVRFKAEAFRDLRHWVRHRMPCVDLDAKLDNGCRDEHLWHLSSPEF